jgi:hypothetical protein
MLAAAAVLLGSVDSAAAVVLLVQVPHEPELPALVPVVPVQVPREPEVPALAPVVLPVPVLVQVPPGLRVLALAQVPPGPVLLLLPLQLPQVVVESEVPLHLQGRQWFSAAMARSSLPTEKPTYVRAPSTR